jgi:hypothetical protein
MRLAWASKLAERAVRLGSPPREEDKKMDDVWELGQIYRAWEQINRALSEAIKPLPRQTLLFLAARASDGIIRAHAAEVLDWRDNRHLLPDWGWAVCDTHERLRWRAEQPGAGGA